MSDSWAAAFVGDRLLLKTEGEGAAMPTAAELENALGRAVVRASAITAEVPRAEGRAVQLYGLPSDTRIPDGYRTEELRAAFRSLSAEQFRAAGTARQKLQWLHTHGFCSRCGAPTERHDQHEAMSCPSCGQLHFARVAPAVIVLVQRDDQALLARSPHFPEGMYSTLAGFVEPGETLEECVHREIAEEVGVAVENLRYFASQPHPFPHSLMIGFVADWRSGDLRIDAREIQDARWFRASDLPRLPHPMSIARALILDFVARVSD